MCHSKIGESAERRRAPRRHKCRQIELHNNHVVGLWINDEPIPGWRHSARHRIPAYPTGLAFTRRSPAQPSTAQSGFVTGEPLHITRVGQHGTRCTLRQRCGVGPFVLPLYTWAYGYAGGSGNDPMPPARAPGCQRFTHRWRVEDLLMVAGCSLQFAIHII